MYYVAFPQSEKLYKQYSFLYVEPNETLVLSITIVTFTQSLGGFMRFPRFYCTFLYLQFTFFVIISTIHVAYTHLKFCRRILRISFILVHLINTVRILTFFVTIHFYTLFYKKQLIPLKYLLYTFPCLENPVNERHP